MSFLAAILPKLQGRAFGIDARALLQFVEFPIDRYDQLIRRDPDARTAALYAAVLDIPPDTEYERLKDNATFAMQLQKIAAALTIQTNWRGHRVRTKYTAVFLGTRSVSVFGPPSTQPSVSRAATPPPVSGNEETVVQSSVPAGEEASKGNQPAEYNAIETVGTENQAGTVAEHRHDVSAGEATCEDPWHAHARRRLAWTFPSAKDFAHDLARQERMVLKYHAYCRMMESLGHEPPLYDEFSVLKIQSMWKMWRARRALFLTVKSMHMSGNGDVAPINYLAREMLHQNVNELRKDQDGAARRIQKVWRRCWSRMIYKYLRDLIRMREASDPRRILKVINPKESHLIDSAAGLRVRFRLGGFEFPPSIYYKIYVHRPTIDLGALAPRNYANPIANSKVNWYQRFENNGWRPIIESVNPYDVLEDAVYVKTTYKKVHYPPVLAQRRDEQVRKRKHRQVQWMQKMYGFQRQDSAIGTPPDDNGVFADVNGKLNLLTSDRGDDAIGFDDSDMVAWSAALDFDQYMQEWVGMATTHAHDDHAMTLLSARTAHLAALAATPALSPPPTAAFGMAPATGEPGLLPPLDATGKARANVVAASRTSSARSRGSVDLQSLFLSQFAD